MNKTSLRTAIEQQKNRSPASIKNLLTQFFGKDVKAPSHKQTERLQSETLRSESLQPAADKSQEIGANNVVGKAEIAQQHSAFGEECSVAEPSPSVQSQAQAQTQTEAQNSEQAKHTAQIKDSWQAQAKTQWQAPAQSQAQPQLQAQTQGNNASFGVMLGINVSVENAHTAPSLSNTASWSGSNLESTSAAQPMAMSQASAISFGQAQVQLQNQAQFQAQIQPQSQDQAWVQTPAHEPPQFQPQFRSQATVQSQVQVQTPSQVQATVQAAAFGDGVQPIFENASENSGNVKLWGSKIGSEEEHVILPAWLQDVVRCGLQESQIEEAIDQVLGENGLFMQHMAHFKYRPGQVEMAKQIARSMFKLPNVQLLEAGTGIGKTLAYLVPTLLGQHRVLISTHLLSLQKQLFLQDIPQVLHLLDLEQSVSYAVLMGRSRYLCRLKVGMVIQAPEVNDFFVPKGKRGKAPSEQNASFLEQRASLLKKAKDGLQFEKVSIAEQNEIESFWLQTLPQLYATINQQDVMHDGAYPNNKAPGLPHFWGEEPLLSTQLEQVPANISFKWLEPLRIAENQCECQYCPFSRYNRQAGFSQNSSGIYNRYADDSANECEEDAIGCWYEQAYATAQNSQVTVINHALLCSKLLPRTTIRYELACLQQHQAQAQAQAQSQGQGQAYVQAQAQGLSKIQSQAQFSGNGAAPALYDGHAEDEKDTTFVLDALLNERKEVIIDEAHAFESELTKTYTEMMDAPSLWDLAQGLVDYAATGEVVDVRPFDDCGQAITELLECFSSVAAKFVVGGQGKIEFSLQELSQRLSSMSQPSPSLFKIMVGQCQQVLESLSQLIAGETL